VTFTLYFWEGPKGRGLYKMPEQELTSDTSLTIPSDVKMISLCFGDRVGSKLTIVIGKEELQ
jgi:hypothetical protein